MAARSVQMLRGYGGRLLPGGLVAACLGSSRVAASQCPASGSGAMTCSTAVLADTWPLFYRGFAAEGSGHPNLVSDGDGGLDHPAAGHRSGCQHQFRIVGAVDGPYEVPTAAKFAVVEVGAHQFKVTPGDVIITEKIIGVDLNDKLELTSVMLLGSRHQTIIGRPLIPDAKVVAAVEEQFLDAKKMIFKKRRRKNSKRLKAHRQPLTSLRILEIHGIEEATSPALTGETPPITPAEPSLSAAHH